MKQDSRNRFLVYILLFDEHGVESLRVPNMDPLGASKTMQDRDTWVLASDFITEVPAVSGKKLPDVAWRNMFSGVRLVG